MNNTDTDNTDRFPVQEYIYLMGFAAPTSACYINFHKTILPGIPTFNLFGV